MAAALGGWMNSWKLPFLEVGKQRDCSGAGLSGIHVRLCDVEMPSGQ